MIEKFKSTLVDKNYTIISEIKNSRNIVLKVSKDSEFFYAKTHINPEKYTSIKNEIDWFNTDLTKFNILKPSLKETFEIEDHLCFISTEVMGDSLENIFQDDKDKLPDLIADYLQNISKIPFIETAKSTENKTQSLESWNSMFYENMNLWLDKIDKTSVELDYIYNLAKSFDINKTGFSPLHGSSLLSEYILKDNNLYILDWDSSSSWYIKNYEDASMLSVLAIRYSTPEISIKIIDKLKNKYNQAFLSVLAQRLLGDISDLIDLHKDVSIGIKNGFTILKYLDDILRR